MNKDSSNNCLRKQSKYKTVLLMTNTSKRSFVRSKYALKILHILFASRITHRKMTVLRRWHHLICTCKIGQINLSDILRYFLHRQIQYADMGHVNNHIRTFREDEICKFIRYYPEITLEWIIPKLLFSLLNSIWGIFVWTKILVWGIFLSKEDENQWQL